MSLRSGELTAMRTAVEDLLTDTCAVTPQTRTVDGGGWSDADGTPTNVSCRYYPERKPMESVSSDRQRGINRWIVEVPHDTTVNISDHIVVDGRTFDVVGPETRTDPLAKRVICVEDVSG
jgi:hypothetical protein